MRRAAPFHRPARFRPVLTLVLATLTLIAGWAGLEVYFAYTAKPAIKVNYGEKLRDLAKEWQVGGEENAWPVLLEVFEIHDEKLASFRDEESGWDWLSTAYGYDAISHYNYYADSISRGYFQIENSSEKGLRLLELHRKWGLESITSFGDLGILDRLDTVAKSRCAFAFVADSELQDKYFSINPFNGKAREFVRSLEATMVWSASRGDWRRYELAFEHCLAIGRIVMLQPSFTARITGTGIRGVALGRLRDHLIDGTIPPSIIPNLRDAYLRQGVLPPKRYSLEAGRLVSLDELQRLFTASGRFIPAEFMNDSSNGTPPHWANNLTSFWQPRWKSSRDTFNHRYDRCIELVEMPRWQRVTEPDYKTMTLRQYTSQARTLETWMSMSASSSLYGDSSDMQDALEQGASLLMAIECFALKNGKYPNSLLELVPEFITEVPNDPYASGPKPWQYRLLDSVSGKERPYILYSVGIDGIDGGGVCADGTSPGSALSMDFQTGDAPSTDYVVTFKYRQP